MSLSKAEINMHFERATSWKYVLSSLTTSKHESFNQSPANSCDFVCFFLYVQDFFQGCFCSRKNICHCYNYVLYYDTGENAWFDCWLLRPSALKKEGKIKTSANNQESDAVLSNIARNTDKHETWMQRWMCILRTKLYV